MAVVIYPFSIGPVIWLEDRKLFPEWATVPVDIFFQPLRCLKDVSAQTSDAFAQYCFLWMRPMPQFCRLIGVRSGGERIVIRSRISRVDATVQLADLARLGHDFEKFRIEDVED